MTRAETYTILARWIENLRDRFNLRTMDDLLGKVKEIQDQVEHGLKRTIVDSSKERKAFLNHQRGEGLCPRCGNVIRTEYWEISSALAFKDPDGCRCLYIALDRESKEGEQRNKPEKERRDAQTNSSPGPARLGALLGDLMGVRSGDGVLPLPP